jgi:hypothetical protein
MATVEVKINVDGLRQLSERFRVVSDELTERVRLLILESAKTTAEVAAANAGQYSKKTPPTIKVIPAERGAIISAGGGDSPLPALLERGSIHKQDPAGWRHPVYSSDRKRWSKNLQRTHPYLRPAVVETRGPNAERISRGLTEYTQETVGRELPQ